MPIDPYAALNAMIRAEAARFTPPPPKAADPELPVEAEAPAGPDAPRPGRSRPLSRVTEAASSPAD
ncbi:hypothetical protein [Streptomyces sp. NPDC051211]|uniref:hypothetical protein n=1 Tax=Streptomyces sp. NPDC051211 TaxID=3154643 RepID=UPI00344DECA0